MLRFLAYAQLCLLAALLAACTKKEPVRVLVFSKTTGFRHESIAPGIAALRQLGQQKGFAVDTTENAEKFTEENLGRYRAVVFLNTTGDVLNATQQNDFERFVQAGGGYVGIHAACDTEYGWEWYGKLAGAYFNGHPMNPNVRQATLRVQDKNNPATDSLPAAWTREDEWYNYKSINPDLKVLLTVDEKTYAGGTNGSHHPVAWYHAFDGGRAFYTGLGHTPETFADPLFVRHLWGGLQYVMGGEAPKALNYTLTKTQRLPEENRFTKVTLAEKLDEPTELAVLDDGRVLFIERKGAVKLYNPTSGQTKKIADIPVNNKYLNGKEAEDGLLGLALDPKFADNHFVYMYYSAAGSEAVNTLCRYVLRGDELDLASKVVMLTVPVQRQECCHTGGSIAFDAKGNLFLSTGDNTNPFGTPYSPTDERAGRNPWDGQKSSGNTNDLRGKILRITPRADGTYAIPAGNLFPVGTPKTRPEVYAMGTRNPYRISVDSHTGFVYWGEIGPDAGKDSVEAGPRGHDEINQARKPGFFGYPFFVGNNKPYVKYDWAAGKSTGVAWNAARPVNNSPNNTGLNQLPPAQSAFIWYPYADSPEFPLMGKGGRNAMAGPVFYADDFKKADRAFPAYYDGKLFIYEWMRDFVMVVTMDKQGNYARMEPFMPGTKFSHPMDMQFGANGDLYLLEYGQNWFAQNDDAKLVRVEYNGGNRKPVVRIAADKPVGATPLTVNFSSKGTKDYDNDKLTYAWRVLGKDGLPPRTFNDANPRVTFDKPGVYVAELTVTDAKGQQTTTQTEVEAGNEPPALSFDITRGNQSFYFPNQPFDYAVRVSDREDGTLGKGIAAEQVAVTIDYLKEGFDQIEVAQGHRTADAAVGFLAAKNLIEASDCKACHGMEKKSVGPAYLAVAQRYKGDKTAVEKLAAKIIKGGGGVWGEQAMSAHPQLTLAQTTAMMQYILSLSDDKKPASLATQGTYVAKLADPKNDAGAFVLRAAYADQGANGIAPLTSQRTLVLRSPRLPATAADVQASILKYELPNKMQVMVALTSDAHLGFKQLDLTDIGQLTFVAFSSKGQTAGGTIEVRLDAPTGALLGQTTAVVPQEAPAPQLVTAALKPTTGRHDVYFVFKNAQAPAGAPLLALAAVQFQPVGAKPAVATKTEIAKPKGAVSMR